MIIVLHLIGYSTVTIQPWLRAVPVLSPVMIHDRSVSKTPDNVDMELEALIKHLLGELRHRETVILENIESLKVKDVD